MFKKIFAFNILMVVFTLCCLKAVAQPAWTIDPFGKEKKPDKYENRKLPSELTDEKKFTRKRHFLQNTITHYNYYFNSNNRVNHIVEMAKLGNKDDYSKLLSFYPYSLDNTAAQKNDLDSVIYKCTAGILLHDLRNDWIDNLYLLIGKAYFYRKSFDSAAMVFQFINYNLFPRKKDEDDNRVVGTNTAAVGNAISIANKEKLNLLQKIASLPPSRNDALIWLVRALIEQNEYGESAGLINTLQNDPNLPKRLQGDLAEANAYWYFKQSIYDSAAVYEEKSLGNEKDKKETARKEFLLAQLYEMNGQTDKASDFYSQAAKHTTDPLMDIYAQLNDAKMKRNINDASDLNDGIARLINMAKKDKFDAYRDIIYYAAAQLALQKPDTLNTVNYLTKSIKYNTNNITYKNKAFLQLGDIAYYQKKYKTASAMYDSLKLNDTAFASNIVFIKNRRDALTKIVSLIKSTDTEDSLQRVAALPEAERDALIKKLVKQLRKQNGLKDESDNNDGAVQTTFGNANNAPADLFAANNGTGEWYFYNSNLKSRGLADFKDKWGTRINVDNWRRKTAVDQAVNLNRAATAANDNADNNAAKLPAQVTYQSLLQNLPLTKEKLDSSNNIVAANLFGLAKLYQNELEDYDEAIKTYLLHLTRYPTQLRNGEIYLGLYYCYKKLGDNNRAAYFKNLLNTSFANSKAWQMVNSPAALNPKTKNPEATKNYDNIYNLFIEGQFDSAIIEKKKADALYGENYWTPQLLYIEALYNIKQCNDSLAIAGLNILIKKNPASPLKEKAATMIDVLKRRKEIETYLINLKVTRANDSDKVVVANNAPAAAKLITVQPNPVATLQKPAINPPKTMQTDTLKKVVPYLTNGKFIIKPDSAHYVVMLLEKVDGVYITEAKNAFNRYNKENYYSNAYTIMKDTIDAQHAVLVISSFADGATAVTYYDKIKKAASREVSWLPANKYSFAIITNENLQLLKNNKDIAGYIKLLNQQYPGKF